MRRADAFLATFESAPKGPTAKMVFGMGDLGKLLMPVGCAEALGKRLATGDRFLKELSRDVDSLGDSPAQRPSDPDSDRP